MSKTYAFQKFKTTRSSGREIYRIVIKLIVAFEEQINLKVNIDNFSEYTKSKNQNEKEKKVLTYEVEKQTQGRGHPSDLATHLKMLILNKCIKDYQ